MPIKLQNLQKNIYRDAPKGVNGTLLLKAFWDEIEIDRDEFSDEILFIKNFIYYLNYGYWCYVDGKPTWLSPWYFSYLNLHRMTTEHGYRYPEFRKKGLYRFLFRHYLHNTTETFADIDDKGMAFKTFDEDGQMRYRMADVGRRLFYGSIEPKDRRGGLTNEYCHIITRIMTAQRGSDKLGTIVSLGGENAEVHFKKKLIPAWNNWPLWLKPIWKGGVNIVKQLEFSSTVPTDIETLDCTINYTESAEDLANDGKMILAAGFDEQGKGKKTGNVQNRWQINKETMSLGAGTNVIGFCMHPSTVEQMNEGGADYKSMCDMSNFYQRKADGQTTSGLALCYMPSSFCLENFIDYWGNPVTEKPTPRQIQAGFKERIGSRVFIKNKRQDLKKEDDPKMMIEYKSFVRKYPEDYDECWTGISGQLGFDNEKLRTRITELENRPKSKRGEFVWTDKEKLIVSFQESKEGKWVICYEMPHGYANRVTTMMDYSAMEDDEISVNAPACPCFIVGLDPQHFSNKSESVFLSQKGTKKSDTAIAVLRKYDPLDVEGSKKSGKARKIVAFMRERLSSSLEATDEGLKAAVYYGGLINPELNVSNVWERLIEQRMGGYLNYAMDIAASGEMRRAPKPGTFLGNNKKDGFDLLSNYITFHAETEDIAEWLKEADEISSIEQLTGYDGLAAIMQAIFGDASVYIDIMNRFSSTDSDEVECFGAESFNY